MEELVYVLVPVAITIVSAVVGWAIRETRNVTQQIAEIRGEISNIKSQVAHLEESRDELKEMVREVIKELQNIKVLLAKSQID